MLLSILAWAKNIKKLQLSLDDAEHVSEVMAGVARAVELDKGYSAREVQQLSVLLLLNSNNSKGRLLQIKTGEGKSTITAMLAAAKILFFKQPVDIITSSQVLAKRDSHEQSNFFNLLDLTCTHNCFEQDTGSKICYAKDIVYGDSLSFQADPKTVNDRGISALYMAAQDGHDKVVELLLGAGADPKTVNAKGISALYMASQNGYDKVVELLLKAGADPKTVNAKGISALYMASRKGHDKVVKLLLEKGVDVTNIKKVGTFSILGMVITYRNIEIVKVLIESKNLGIFGKNDNSERPKDNHLLLALRNDLEITKLLLKELSFPSYQIKEAQNSKLDIHNLLNAVEGTNLESVTFKSSSNHNTSLDSIANSNEIGGTYSNCNDKDKIKVLSFTSSADNSNDQSSSSLQELITQQQIGGENIQDDVNSIGHTTHSTFF